MQSSSGYASIWCTLLHQLQPRDSMAPISRGMPNEYEARDSIVSDWKYDEDVNVLVLVQSS